MLHLESYNVTHFKLLFYIVIVKKSIIIVVGQDKI